VDEIELRPLTRADYGLLSEWLAQAHVARWWHHETSAAHIEADFGAVIDGNEAGEVFIASTGGRPFGLIQRYAYADYPEYLEEVSRVVEVPDGAVSMDYFVGESSLLNRGLGSSMVRALLDRTWQTQKGHDGYERATAVIIPVVVANTASWRTLENAGMRRVAQGQLSPDNPIDGDAHFLYRIDRPRGL
jgi:aminoglycoside 6'-N-acetyltransferase